VPESAKQGATGIQIAFLIFAVMLLAAPADRYFLGELQWVKESGFPIGRALIFLFGGSILLIFPPLRRLSFDLLATPIPSTMRKELGVVIALALVTAFAAVGALVFWWWSVGGAPEVVRRMSPGMSAAEQWNRATSFNGIVTAFILGGIVGPIIEELVFRGMLYPAWAARWGWIPSAFATSFVFAMLHANANGLSQFLESLLFICLFRRTGSLRASIVAHSVLNISIWYPFLGQFLFPRAGRETSDLVYWAPHLASLVVVLFATPLYMRMSRDAKAALASDSPQAASRRS
jgi:membrane protease YdiL (CAAX protease family)